MVQEDLHAAAETVYKGFEDEAVRLVRTSGRTQSVFEKGIPSVTLA